MISENLTTAWAERERFIIVKMSIPSKTITGSKGVGESVTGPIKGIKITMFC